MNSGFEKSKPSFLFNKHSCVKQHGGIQEGIAVFNILSPPLKGLLSKKATFIFGNFAAYSMAYLM